MFVLFSIFLLFHLQCIVSSEEERYSTIDLELIEDTAPTAGICDIGPNPCLNGGTCILRGSEEVCACLPGTFGPVCENVTGCLSQTVVCTDQSNSFCGYSVKKRAASCICNNSSLEYNDDTGDCEKPCPLNCVHGRCAKVGDSYKCYCSTEYTGELCELKDICYYNYKKNYCYNGGKCITTGHNSYRCECTWGYHGLKCEKRSTTSDPTATSPTTTRKIHDLSSTEYWPRGSTYNWWRRTAEPSTHEESTYDWWRTTRKPYTSSGSDWWRESRKPFPYEESTYDWWKTTRYPYSSSETPYDWWRKTREPFPYEDSTYDWRTTRKPYTNSESPYDWWRTTSKPLGIFTDWPTDTSIDTSTTSDRPTTYRPHRRDKCRYNRDCFNGGICKIAEFGNYCLCKFPFSGHHCETNDVCSSMTNTCETVGAVCVYNSWLQKGFCECPAYQIWDRKWKRCRDLCDHNKCENGVCEIVDQDRYKCRCKLGHTGDYCDQKQRYDNFGLFVVGIILVAAMICFVFLSIILAITIRRIKKLQSKLELKPVN